MAYLLVILCKIWRDFLCGGMEDCYPTHRAILLRDEWGTLCVAGAGERQKQPGVPIDRFFVDGVELQILRLRSG
jgi:hypothetical protein